MTDSGSRFLAQLLASALPGVAVPSTEVQITDITDNSSRVSPGSLFVATRGTRVDGHDFIADAVTRGAAAIVAERNPGELPVPCIVVEDSRNVLGYLAHAWHGHPTRAMRIAAVTGTNGKTTTTYIMEAILRAAGENPGVIGTIEHRYDGKAVAAQNTTPSALELAALFAEMRDAGVTAVVMEASSHAIEQRRISGIEFDAASFTNLTQDHLDFHVTMEAYERAKLALFTDYLQRPRTKAGRAGAAFDCDHEVGARFAAAFGDAAIRLSPAGDPTADLRAENIEYRNNGTMLDLVTNDARLSVLSPLMGPFNVQNLLCACGAMTALGVPLDVMVRGIAGMGNVPGRFERVEAGQDFVVLVDYAHTPDALSRALTNARELAGNNRLIVVFGCGGDRDTTKRAPMGRIAVTLADVAVLTNDNPRTEDPQRIADMVLEGMRVAAAGGRDDRVILDREDAIDAAIQIAAPGDVVVIAGKGHENYQILGTDTIHFDDREVALACMQKRRGTSLS